MAETAITRHADDVVFVLGDGSLVSMAALADAEQLLPDASDIVDIASVVHPDDHAACRRWISELCAGRQIGERRTFRIGDGAVHRLKEFTSIALEPPFPEPTVHAVLVVVDVDGRTPEATGSLRARHPEGFGVSAHLSHELRSPLTAILGFGGILVAEATTESQREAAEYVVRAGEHVLSMLDALVKAASEDRGGESHELDVLAIFHEASRMLMPLARARGITFSFEPGSAALAIADAVLVRQIAVNLISNAIKYNRPGGEVRLRIDLTGDGFVRLSVSDDGIGIDPSRRARLFVPFDRLDVETLGIQGEGIGLALSKRLANAMGGEIGSHANAGVGTTFWLDLRRPHRDSHEDSTATARSEVDVRAS